MYSKIVDSDTYDFIKKIINRYGSHNVSMTSAYMAYYWLLAFFPFIIFIISLLSYTNIPTSVLMEYLARTLPDTLVPLVEDTIAQFIVHRSTTVVSIGGLITLWSAGTAMNALTRGIYIAYNSKKKKHFIRMKLASIIYAVLLALTIVIMIVGLVFGNQFGDYLFRILDMKKGIFMPIWNLARLTMPFIALVFVLYPIYKFIPRKYIKNSIVWPGVIFTSIGWYGFSLIFSVYVDNYSKYSLLYGSIGSVFVLLIWLYGSCTLLVLGAEINAQIQEIGNSKIVRKIKINE